VLGEGQGVSDCGAAPNDLADLALTCGFATRIAMVEGGMMVVDVGSRMWCVAVAAALLLSGDVEVASA
jgi:hypothetical protein